MTSEQKRLVRESFPAVREMAGPVSMLFYGRLFALDPSLRPMFRQDIELQGRKLMDMLTAVVDNLDHFEGMAPALRALGQKHVGYGVRPEHYKTVGKALMWALGQTLDAEFFPELRDAWLAIIEAVSAGMKNGAAELPPA
jgi:hemoglobin-like flavoprotein